MNAKVFQVLNDIKAEGLVEDYAVGGRMATMLHTGVGASSEMDVFVIMPKKMGVLVSMRDFPQSLVVSGAMPTWFPPPGSRPYTDDPRFVGPDLTGPINDYLRSRGYPLVSENVLMEGVPTQFIPADKLETEAVKHARKLNREGMEVRVIAPEYLVAIAVRYGKPRDRENVSHLMGRASLDRKKLGRILRKHKLADKFERGFDAAPK